MMLRSEPTDSQRTIAGILGLGFAGLLGLWLMMSYFGIWTSDAKVSINVTAVGDAIGPGAKVRYHDVIVGRVLKLEDNGDGYQLKIVVDKDHAESIPNTATARILPSTIFGSEYVELLSDSDASGSTNALSSGDVLQEDGTDSTLRLMESFDSAERLISAIDAEDINRITGKLAPALDGHGDDIKSFLERADAVVTDINEDLPTTWETLRLTPTTLDTLADITPDLVSAAENSQKTSETIADRNKQLSELLTDTTRVMDQGHTLIAKNREVIVPFVSRLERLTGLVADNSDSLQAVLTHFAAVGNNGANGIDDNAIQMIGTIGTEMLEPYTAADCARYGPTLIALNCGDPVPAAADDAAASEAAISLADQFGALLGGAPGGTAATDGTKPSPTASAPVAGQDPSGLGGILGLLGFGGGR